MTLTLVSRGLAPGRRQARAKAGDVQRRRAPSGARHRIQSPASAARSAAPLIRRVAHASPSAVVGESSCAFSRTINAVGRTLDAITTRSSHLLCPAGTGLPRCRSASKQAHGHAASACAVVLGSRGAALRNTLPSFRFHPIRPHRTRGRTAWLSALRPLPGGRFAFPWRKRRPPQIVGSEGVWGKTLTMTYSCMA